MECTVNRVGDEYVDQTVCSGHHERLSDLDRIAGLGVRAVRYPVLWERVAPDSLERADWGWVDERLGRLRALGVRPIAGLVHHGSGPRHTSLVDPAFPAGLAAFAQAVAERYPWLDAYTPVNEPLTTARFSGLYGHWYPHGHNALTFARALLTQCRAVVEAMAAIRRVNPAAQLVQTEDLGKTYSTPRLAYQAAFENERRWLTWDLLRGAVGREHPMWGYLRWVGVDEADLAWLLEHPCPPDVVGINSYITSERVLDEHLLGYLEDRRGGNGRDAYADMEAARVRAQGIGAWGVLVREAWERYHLPIAVTEVHIGSTRDDQLRWLWQAWTSCQALRDQQGVDVRAVTVWSLFGAFDWDHLVTCGHGSYEPGAFDVRAPEPRPTALAWLMRQLASGTSVEHPVLETPGWWRRPDRFWAPPLWTEPPASGEVDVGRAPDSSAPRRPLLITGATGTLGRAFARLCQARGLAHRLLSRQDMDIADSRSVQRVLHDLQPWAVINTAGYVRVDEAERDADRCRRENVLGPAVLAAACAARGTRLVTFSSDLVFDGAKGAPYLESDPVAPLNMYGRSKVEAEQRVLSADPSALVVRTSAFFGPWDAHNFVYHALRALAAGEVFVAADDAVVSPTYVPDLVHTSLDLLLDGEQGIWHLANAGAMSWLELARCAAELAGVSTRTLHGRPTAALELAAARPRFSALSSERGWVMPSLEDALARFLKECETTWAPEVADADGASQALRLLSTEDQARGVTG
jgi:dTDP-4-dehydrorhamnose reductase